MGASGGKKKSAAGLYVYIEGHPYKVGELATQAGVDRKTIVARIEKLRAEGRPLCLDEIVVGGQQRGRWK